jgi:non-specific serine/threonine protein kinase
VGSVIDLADRLEYESDVAALQSELGKETYATIRGEGESMPLDTVIHDALGESARESMRGEREYFGGLTARERVVAVLISQGKTNREIAEDMTVGVKTVETYITRILNKLGFDSRVQIATWMIEKSHKEKESP